MKTYDKIGRSYTATRRPDPRIERAIWQELAGCETIVNVGAGTGSYEPTDRFVIAVEPSVTMIQQRCEHAAPVVRAEAAGLPFSNESFDASLAVLTVHHWTDWNRGLRELARVARRRVVILTWDPDSGGFWLLQRYLPDLLQLDRDKFPTIDGIETVLSKITVNPLPIPRDCTDGFMGAYWGRPEAYLDSTVRTGISSFQLTSGVDDALAQLEKDLQSGLWNREYGDLRSLSELDVGYRIVISDKQDR